MAGTLSPAPWLQPLDDDGNIIPGGKLFTYTAGTSTKVATYTDVLLAVPNTNPIILDAAGRCTIYLVPGSSYKYVLSPSTDTDPPTDPIRTQDNIQAVPGSSAASSLTITGLAGQAISAGQVVYKAAAGSWFIADSAATGSSSLADTIGIALASISNGSTGLIQLYGEVTGLSGLTDGVPYYVGTAGALTATPPTHARPVGQASSTTSIILSQWVRGAKDTLAPIINDPVEFAGAVTFDSMTQTVGQAQFTIPPKFQPGTSTGTYIPVSGLIYSNSVAVNSVIGTNALMNTTLPANVFSHSNAAVRITAQFNAVNNAHAKSINFAIGGTGTGATGNTWTALVNKAYIIWAEVLLIRPSVNVQKIGGFIQGQDTAGTVISIYVNLDTGGAETETATIVVGFMSTTVTAAADIVQTMMTVEVLG